MYAEVYNPSVDPSTRQTAVEVLCEIQADGAATPLFSQDIASSSSVYDGTKISIAKMWHDLKLTPAKYWLRLRATDTIKKQTVVSRMGFEVQ